MHDYRGPRSRVQSVAVASEVVGVSGAIGAARSSIMGRASTRSAALTVAAAIDDIRHRTSSVTIAPTANTRTLIVGWWGTETIGDQAILAGIESALRDIPGETDDVAIVSMEPFITAETLRAIGRTDWSIIQHAEAMAEIQAGKVRRVLVGGGPLLAIRPLKQLEVLLTTAQQSKSFVGLVGCGIGPVRDRWAKKSVRRILAASDYIGVRDEPSARWARDAGHENVANISDPALWFVCATKAQPRNKGPVIAPRYPDPLYVQGATSRSSSSFVDGLASAIDNSGRSFESIAMHSHHVGGDDRWMLRDLAARTERVAFSWSRRDLNDTVKLVRQSQFLVAGRYHALVFGAASATPTVVLDYSGPTGKISAFAAEHGLESCTIDAWSDGFELEQTIQSAMELDWSSVAERLQRQAVAGRESFVADLTTR